MNKHSPIIVTPDIKLGKDDVLMVTIPCGRLPPHAAKRRCNEVIQSLESNLPKTKLFPVVSRGRGPVKLTKITQEV